MRALTPTQSTLQQIVKENSPHTNTQDTIYDIDTMSFLPLSCKDVLSRYQDEEESKVDHIYSLTMEQRHSGTGHSSREKEETFSIPS